MARAIVCKKERLGTLYIPRVWGERAMGPFGSFAGAKTALEDAGGREGFIYETESLGWRCLPKKRR